MELVKRRFVFLLRCLRFDNTNTRTQKKKEDNLPPIRPVFDHCNQLHPTRKTQYFCSKYQELLCLEHIHPLCNDCAQEGNEDYFFKLVFALLPF